jgi:hypothetical protein
LKQAVEKLRTEIDRGEVPNFAKTDPVELAELVKLFLKKVSPYTLSRAGQTLTSLFTHLPAS